MNSLLRFFQAPIVLRIDGLPRPARLASRKSVRVARRGGLCVVTPNNDAPKTLPLTFGGETAIAVAADAVRLSVRTARPVAGGMTLHLVALDAEGRSLGRVPARIRLTRQDWIVRLPEAARTLTLAMRFTTETRFAPLRIDLAFGRTGVETPPGEAPRVVTAEATQAAQRLHADRRYLDVVALHAQPIHQTDAISLLAFTGLVELRRFSDAIDLHRRFCPDDGLDVRWERRLLEAMGNEGLWDAVLARLRGHLARPSGRRLELLLQALPFAARDPALRARVLETIASDSLRPGTPFEPGMAEAAALAVAEPPTPLLERFVDRVLEDEALPPAEGDLLASQRRLRQGDTPGHWAAFNQALARFGLGPLRPADGAGEGPATLGRLAPATTPEPVADGPLISVVTTAFNAASTIGYAIGSLAAQSYLRLEIVLVDDASDDDTVAVATAAAGGRALKVIRRTTNAGTYVCRNMGLRAATGDYVFNQDADDWSHPEKVARLAAALTPEAIAAWGRALRMGPDGRLQARRGYIGGDGNSLMFRREPVLAALGGYEEVRAGGDGEFHRRLERVFGRKRIVLCNQPLSIIAVRDASLSRSGTFAIDQATGVFTPERNAYRRAYLERHAALAAADVAED